MAIRLYLYLLLSLVTCLGCKAQSKTVTDSIIVSPQATVDSVSYEIIRDSVYSPFLGDMYRYGHLKVEHEIKPIENKLNNSLMNYAFGSIMEESPRFILIQDYKKKLVHFKDSVGKYVKRYAEFNKDLPHWMYNIILNEKSIFAIRYVCMADREYYSYLNLDLKTGNPFKIEELIQDEQEFLSFLNERNKTLLKSELDLMKKKVLESQNSEFYKEEVEYINEALDNYEYTNHIPQWYFHKEKEEFGMYFNGWYYPGDEVSYLIALTFFVPFKDIYPYCTDTFKKRLESDFNISNK